VSRFLTPLRAEKSGDYWTILQPLIYMSDLARNTFVVPEGFVTDLASVPRIPIAYWLAGGECDEAAVVHDYTYATGMVSREIADAVFREAALATGQPAWRVQSMWFFLRAFGWKAWNEHRSRELGSSTTP
jgi:hypothetical protein